jgi:hypothetical protein
MAGAQAVVVSPEVVKGSQGGHAGGRGISTGTKEEKDEPGGKQEEKPH